MKWITISLHVQMFKNPTSMCVDRLEMSFSIWPFNSLIPPFSRYTGSRLLPPSSFTKIRWGAFTNVVVRKLSTASFKHNGLFSITKRNCVIPCIAEVKLCSVIKIFNIKINRKTINLFPCNTLMCVTFPSRCAVVPSLLLYSIPATDSKLIIKANHNEC